MHRRLIQLAEQIAEIDPNRPSQAALRRATSTAYYAVFHGLCQLAADILAGRGAPYDDWSPVYRSFDHKDLQTVKQKDSGPRRLGQSIHLILDAAIVLKRQRMEADYNPEPLGLGRVAVRARVASAKATLDAIDNLTSTEKRALAVALVTRRRP